MRPLLSTVDSAVSEWNSPDGLFHAVIVIAEALVLPCKRALVRAVYTARCCARDEKGKEKNQHETRRGASGW